MANYCFTDLHGMYNLWVQIRDYANPTDRLYFLGDAMDRGPDGIKVIHELLSDPRVTFIKGNHEDIFVNCAKELMKKPRDIYDTIYLWHANGGGPSYAAYRELNRDSKQELINKCDALPEYIRFKSDNGHEVFLCHAGTCLHYDMSDRLLVRGNPYLWDRHHFNMPWDMEKDANLYMVHGHTPVHYIKPALGINLVPELDKHGLPNILTYAEDHKFNLDLASFETKKIALFDLDKLKVAKYFYAEDIS